MIERKQLKVFLCHASEDKPAVRELYHQLSAENWIDVWLDTEKLLPGQDWDLEIEKAVGEANIVVACISNNSVDKEGYIQRELRAVLSLAEEKPEGTIFIIPLKLEDCIIPRRLQNWQWVDYFPVTQRNQAYQRLLESLKLRAKSLDISIEPPRGEAEAEKIISLTEVSLGALRAVIRPHAFVIMPFGKKKGGDGAPYDFNAIYVQLIKPTLEMAGFEPFRADEETSSGDILTDMFQELLLADICLVDMSIDNANVFYELGIRHAFRKRGIVHIQAGRAYMPFEIFNVRTIPYHITHEGVPDPEFLEKDKAAIARVTRDTWASEAEAIHSPVFNMLTGLVEPERRSLRTPLATGFWREYNEWKQRVAVAQRQKRIGDILLLTEEITNPLIQEEAVGEAARALSSTGRFDLALAQYRRGLELNPRNMNFRREEAFHLNRLDRREEAIIKLESILKENPNDNESSAYLGQIYKETWLNSWKDVIDTENRLTSAFDACHWLIEAFQTYMRGFLTNLSQYYLGTNAMTLGSILEHLADRFDDPKDPDPEIRDVREKLPDLRGALKLVLEAYSEDDRADYWTLNSLAELRVLNAKSPSQVARAYRKAVSVSRQNLSHIMASINQLEIYWSLQLRPEFAQVGLKTLKEEYSRISKEAYDAQDESPDKTEGRIFLFAGYMINNPQKKRSHFPPELEGDLRKAIHRVLEKLDAGPDDIAITTGMDAGSEILFVESCVERSIPVQAYLPSPEAPYVRDFVSPGGENWVERFYRLRNHPLVEEFYQLDQVGSPREYDNVHERNNRWALYSSLIRGIDKISLIAVWNEKNESSEDLDARLVKHMVDLMRATGGGVEIINPYKLHQD